jgi:Flp pilus assembly protein TadD
MEEGKVAEANARVKTAVAEGPANPDLLMFSAHSAMAQRDFVQAEQTLQRLVQLQPSNVEARTLLGYASIERGNADAALKHFEEVVKLQPRSVGAHTQIGLILHSQGKVTEARARYQEVLSIDPSAPAAANNLAWLLVDSGGDLDEALRLAQSASRRMPNEPQFSDTVGWIYVKKRRASLAIPHFERAVALNGKNPVFLYHLGAAYAELGDREKARRTLEQALKLASTFDGAADARQILAGLK